MFSTSTLLVASLSALSLVAAAPVDNDHLRDCIPTPKYGALCKLNDQDPSNSTVLTDTFSFSAYGHSGSNNFIEYFTLDFQPVQSPKFYPIDNAGFFDQKGNVFHADDVKIPCGLNGQARLNLVAHSQAGAKFTPSVGLQTFGPFEVHSPAC